MFVSRLSYDYRQDNGRVAAVVYKAVALAAAGEHGISLFQFMGSAAVVYRHAAL